MTEEEEILRWIAVADGLDHEPLAPGDLMAIRWAVTEIDHLRARLAIVDPELTPEVRDRIRNYFLDITCRTCGAVGSHQRAGGPRTCLRCHAELPPRTHPYQ